MKTVFRDKWQQYALTSVLGILAGVSVGLADTLPSDDLWGFAFWATGAYGFWMFSCALLTLLSENRKAAVIHTGLYVLFLYLVTVIIKAIHEYAANSVYRQQDSSLLEYVLAPDRWFSYSWLAVLAVLVLSTLLYFGRMDNIPGKVIRLLPLCYIIFEGCAFARLVITQRQMLFYTLVDLVCAALYFLLIKDSFKKTKQQAKCL